MNDSLWRSTSVRIRTSCHSIALTGTGRTVLSTYLDREDDSPVRSVGLRANEGVIVRLEGSRS